MNRDKVLVVIYHDVLPDKSEIENPMYGLTVTPEEFDWQIQELKKHYTPINVHQLELWLNEKAKLPHNSFLVTFDDGHRNNLTYAASILKEHKIPAVNFVIAGMIGIERQPLWFEDIYLRIMDTKKDEITIGTEIFTLENVDAKRNACGKMFDSWRSMSLADIKNSSILIKKQLPESPSVVNHIERIDFLDKSDCELLIKMGVVLGSHSMTHALLKSLDEDEASQEILGSRNFIESILGEAPKCFAYPFGEPEKDYSRRDMEIVKRAGYEIAFAGSGGLINKHSNRFSLPRVGLGPVESKAYFHFMISGFRNIIRGT